MPRCKCGFSARSKKELNAHLVACWLAMDEPVRNHNEKNEEESWPSSHKN